MSFPFRLVASTLLLALLAACATLRAPPATTFVIVRHAEKVADDSQDPALTTEGTARAQRLAAALATAPLVAVYATGFQRTQQTAAPTAQAHALPITTYDAKMPAAEFAALLRRNHRRGHVLVVAHSNTAPGIAAALCRCEVAPMDESEYDRRMTVQVPAHGPAMLISASMP